MISPSLASRIHIVPGAFARSPGHVSEHFAGPTAALAATEALLRPLPKPLVAWWLAAPRGHIVLNTSRHGFSAGPGRAGKRDLTDVAWLQISAYLDDVIRFCTPIGGLLMHIVGWGQTSPFESPLAAWDQVRRGIAGCFRAGYGRSEDARRDIDCYVAEGVGWYLADRRGLNVQDPRLQKLLAATVFNPDAYRRPSS